MDKYVPRVQRNRGRRSATTGAVVQASTRGFSQKTLMDNKITIFSNEDDFLNS